MSSNARTAARVIASISHFAIWASSIIVVAISGYYLSNSPDSMHMIYYMVIGATTLAFWLPSFLLPFSKSYRAWYLPLNFIWSYLWLTAFIFACQDYNRGDCFANAPFGRRCAPKRGLQAFIFVAFFFSLVAIAADVLNLVETEEDTRHIEKEVRHSDATGTTAP